MNIYKKAISTTLTVLSSLVVLISCSTTVSVSYMQPAKYDLTQYKKLAVASMQVVDAQPFSDSYITIRYDNFEGTVFSGYDRRIASNISQDFTEQIYTDLYKTAYFDLIKPVITDGYINNYKYGLKSIEKLKDLGAQAILVSEIDFIDYQEYPIIGDYKMIINPEYATDDPTEPQYIESIEREVKITQQASIKFNYKVIAIDTGEIIASQSFTKTLTNEIEYKENLISLDPMEPLFYKGLIQGEKQIVSDLTPQFISTSISLKTDKSKNAYFNAGIEAAKKSKLKVAYDNFDAAWNSSKLYAAGYNSALVLEARGEREEAIERMTEVYNNYKDTDSYDQITRMKQYKNKTNAAQTQINN